MIADVCGTAALMIPPDGEDQKTMCDNGHGLTTPKRLLTLGGAVTGLHHATTTGSDSGAKVRPDGPLH